MTLLDRQQEFARMIPKLINKAIEMGYSVTLGNTYRDPRALYGSMNSLHKSRLAIDLNLFIGDTWLKETEDHAQLGEYWESIGGSWGGRFNDGNHYSLSWRGMK